VPVGDLVKVKFDALELLVVLFLELLFLLSFVAFDINLCLGLLEFARHEEQLPLKLHAHINHFVLLHGKLFALLLV
jgi:hypothetical protein